MIPVVLAGFWKAANMGSNMVDVVFVTDIVLWHETGRIWSFQRDVDDIVIDGLRAYGLDGY